MPAATILRFARVIRAAIVDSLTRNSRAISLTVSPATRRSVSAALDRRGHRRVAAHEDQPQPVVDDLVTGGRWLGRRCAALVDGEQRQLAGGDRLGPQRVEGAPPGGGQQPPGGVRRDTRRSATCGWRGVGLLDGVLGEVDALELADQQGDEATPVLGRSRRPRR